MFHPFNGCPVNVNASLSWTLTGDTQGQVQAAYEVMVKVSMADAGIIDQKNHRGVPFSLFI